MGNKICRMASTKAIDILMMTTILYVLDTLLYLSYSALRCSYKTAVLQRNSQMDPSSIVA